MKKTCTQLIILVVVALTVLPVSVAGQDTTNATVVPTATATASVSTVATTVPPNTTVTIPVTTATTVLPANTTPLSNITMETVSSDHCDNRSDNDDPRHHDSTGYPGPCRKYYGCIVPAGRQYSY